MTTQPFYSPPDMAICAEMQDAACGHGALAAALGIPVVIVMAELFAEQGGWVNIPMMKEAIGRAEKGCVRLAAIPSAGSPGAGVAIVQWLGRWMEPQVPRAARAAHRHWIAFREGFVWDANRPEWIPLAEWHRWVPILYGPKDTGHEIEAAYLICEP